MQIVINGANGKMGHMIAEMAGEDNIAARVDITFENSHGCYKNLNDFNGAADCVIDFSNHKAVNGLLEYCKKRNLPVLIASTGHTEDEIKMIHEAAKQIPVFFSPNMSIGVALLADVAERVAKLFGDCDIELIETHHNQKLDVPSGTALMLAQRIKEAKPDLVFNVGRHENGKRPANEIGIHSLRYGSEVGTHEIIFSNGLETITLKHDAKNRALFARGALAAAKWLLDKSAGLYTMKDFLNEA